MELFNYLKKIFTDQQDINNYSDLFEDTCNQIIFVDNVVIVEIKRNALLSDIDLISGIIQSAILKFA